VVFGDNRALNSADIQFFASFNFKTMKKYILLYISLIFLYSCKDEVELTNNDFPFIILHKISSISSSGVAVSASLYNGNEVHYSEYGLVIDRNNNPSVSDRKIVLNNNPGKDLTVRISNDLVKGETYYVRAFVRTSDSLIYSNMLSFKSEGCLPPSMSAISSESATSGNRIIIKGNNFSELISNNEVWFNDLKARIIKASIDTLIVFCPNTLIDRSVKIKVTVATQTTETSQEFKLLNPWKQIGDFPANPTIFNGQFVYNSKGYLIPGGIISGSEVEKLKFWEFDLNSNKWNIISNIPFTTGLWTVGFAKGNDLYCGLGRYQRELWQFNLDTKTWIQKSSFPGLLRYSFIYPCFQINNTVYLYSYQDGSSEFWKYLIESNKWIQLPTPTELNNREFICGYLYNNSGYLLEMHESVINHAFTIWKFYEATNSFTKDHSVTVNSRIETGSFIIKDNLYIPTRMGNLIQYSLTDGLVFYLDDPTDIYEYSFVFQKDNKAIVGREQTLNVYEFYPR
jgi:hypothetical protein